MDKNLRSEWINTLRDTTVEKAVGSLRNDDKRDALGILLDLTQLGTWQQDRENYWFFEDEPFNEKNPHEWCPSYVCLGPRLRKKVGISLAEQEMVMSMNDADYTFSEIAEAVAKNIL